MPYNPMLTMPLSRLCDALRADMTDAPESEFEAFELWWENEDGFLDHKTRLHILWHAPSGRAGLCVTGSGASGVTRWTDAVSPAHALHRLMADDMSP